MDTETEDLPEILSFQHKLIQEYFAALFIAEQIKVDRSFLATTFPSTREIISNSDLLRFICGHLASQDARPVTNHISNIGVDEIPRYYKLGYFQSALVYRFVKILETCCEEGCVSTINPYLSIYPSCGHILSDTITNSQLVIINGVNENDPLKLETSSVPVVVNIMFPEERHEEMKKEVSRLMRALASAKINLQVVSCNIMHDDVCKLHSFSQLRCIDFSWPFLFIPCDQKHIGDLTDSINSWGPEPQLRSLTCGLPILADRRQAISLYIPLIQALSKCSHLEMLFLDEGNLSDCIPALMGAPPPQLKHMCLRGPTLHDNVIESIAKAVRNHKLQQLEGLLIVHSPITEAALTTMVKAFVDVRPDKKLYLVVDCYPPELEALCKPTKITLSDSSDAVASFLRHRQI